MLLLMLISKKAAAPMSKGSKKCGCLFTNIISKNAQKSSHPYINKMLKKVAAPILKGFKKSSRSFAKANFQKAATTGFTFHKGQRAKRFLL